MRCPICDSMSSDDSAECETCGKLLLAEAELEEDEPPLDGLEATVLDPLESAAGAIAPLEAMERTQLADPQDLEVVVESIAVERTPIEAPLDLQGNWSGTIELTPTCLPDDGARTVAPVDTGHCPWCGAEATFAVCDACGRRRSRYSNAPEPGAQNGNGESGFCPACFSRVIWGPKCPECGVPLPLRDLL